MIFTQTYRLDLEHIGFKPSALVDRFESRHEPVDNVFRIRTITIRVIESIVTNNPRRTRAKLDSNHNCVIEVEIIGV